MSYFVKGGTPPKSCGNCPHNYSSLKCTITKSTIDRDDEYRERLSDCPIIEVKEPHGRLGDLDKLIYEIVVGNQKYLGLNESCLEDITPIENVDDCIDAIAFAPSIIEAEWG